jgi:hypothetical protein
VVACGAAVVAEAQPDKTIAATNKIDSRAYNELFLNTFSSPFLYNICVKLIIFVFNFDYYFKVTLLLTRT